MMKPLLIALAILLVIPNFISKDINEPAVFDHKERYNPALASLRSVDQLEKYVDAVAAQKNIQPGTGEYTTLLAYIISCRFYHGFSHWKLSENWIAAVGQKITGIGLACKVKPEDIMKHPNAACSQQALVMMEVLRRKNINYRKVGFPHHYALEVQLQNQWYYFDPNMEPKIKFTQRAHNNWKGENDLIKNYYPNTAETDLTYRFGNGQKAEFGVINEVPARNARFFQGFTGILSKVLWCIPFLLSFAVKKKPYMYAVKPINKNYNPPPKLRPVYYA